jgi:hypothetical protein
VRAAVLLAQLLEHARQLGGQFVLVHRPLQALAAWHRVARQRLVDDRAIEQRRGHRDRAAVQPRIHAQGCIAAIEAARDDLRLQSAYGLDVGRRVVHQDPADDPHILPGRCDHVGDAGRHLALPVRPVHQRTLALVARRAPAHVGEGIGPRVQQPSTQ